MCTYLNTHSPKHTPESKQKWILQERTTSLKKNINILLSLSFYKWRNTNKKYFPPTRRCCSSWEDRHTKQWSETKANPYDGEPGSSWRGKGLWTQRKEIVGQRRLKDFYIWIPGYSWFSASDIITAELTVSPTSCYQVTIHFLLSQLPQGNVPSATQQLLLCTVLSLPWRQVQCICSGDRHEKEI